MRRDVDGSPESSGADRSSPPIGDVHWIAIDLRGLDPWTVTRTLTSPVAVHVDEFRSLDRWIARDSDVRLSWADVRFDDSVPGGAHHAAGMLMSASLGPVPVELSLSPHTAQTCCLAIRLPEGPARRRHRRWRQRYFDAAHAAASGLADHLTQSGQCAATDARSAATRAITDVRPAASPAVHVGALTRAPRTGLR